MKNWLCLGLVSAGLLLVNAGCEDGGGSSGGGGGSVVGTWAVKQGTTPSSTDPDTFWVFYDNGTFTYFNDSSLSSEHLSGTYTQDGSHFFGPFTNPGVGEGEIDGTVNDDGETFQMEFIEHWHSPYKHVDQAGIRLD